MQLVVHRLQELGRRRRVALECMPSCSSSTRRNTTRSTESWLLWLERGSPRKRSQPFTSSTTECKAGYAWTTGSSLTDLRSSRDFDKDVAPRVPEKHVLPLLVNVSVPFYCFGGGFGGGEATPAKHHTQFLYETIPLACNCTTDFNIKATA